jgi:hypothetical protein
MLYFYVLHPVVYIDLGVIYHHPNKLHRETFYEQKKIQFTKSNDGAIRPQYPKYPNSQKSIDLNILTYNDHIEVLRNFSALHINISRSACMYIRAGHMEANMKIFKPYYSSTNVPTTRTYI